MYLGLYDCQESAAQAYDSALVRLRGPSAATNFSHTGYRSDLAAYHRLQQVGPAPETACLVLGGELMS